MPVAEVPFTELLSAIVDNRGRTAPTADSGIPLIATNCIKEDALYPVFEKVRYVDENTYESWFRGHPLPGDIIFVCKGSPGRVVITPDPVTFCIAQDMVAVRPDPTRVYPRFLFAVLRSQLVRNRINNMHVGTLIPHFKKGDFSNLMIPMVGDPLQRVIGDMYYELSDKIESNLTIKSHSEELAQTYFRSWFVNYERWGGEVPRDWIHGHLSDVLTSIKQTTRAGDQTALPYVPIDVLPMRSFGLLDFRPNNEAQSSLIRFQKNDILIGAMRVYFHRVAIAPFDGVTRSTSFVLRPNDPTYLEYCLLLCNEDSTIGFAESTSKGSTMPYAVWDGGLANMPLIVPSREAVEEFGSLVHPLVERVRDSLFEIRKLSELRDTLLADLLSSRISPARVEAVA